MGSSDTHRRTPGVTGDAIERIRELIVTGEWGPGTRLPQRLLCWTFCRKFK